MADPEIVTEARARLGARLAALRQAAGYTQESFARLTMYGRSTVANVERGRQRVQRDFWERCDTILHADPSLATEYDAIERLRADHWRTTSVALTKDHYKRALGIQTSTTTVGVRPAEDALTSAGWPQTGASTPSSPTEFGVAYERDLRECTTDEIHTLVRSVSDSYLHEAPTQVYEVATRLADQMMSLVQERSGEARRRGIYLGAGYLYALLGWIAGDVGLLQDAHTHNRTAWLCAEIVDHPSLRAWVLSTMSKTAMWEGRHTEAAEYAAAGQRFPAAGSAAVMLACQEADAHAERGLVEHAYRALDRSGEAAAHAGIDEIGGLLSCGQLRHDNYTSSVLLRTGAPAKAIAVAVPALAEEAMPRSAQGTVAQLRISVAQAHLALGEVGQAAAVLEPVLAIPHHRRLSTITQRVRQTARLIDARAELRGHAAAQSLSSAITSTYGPAAGIPTVGARSEKGTA